MQILRYETDDGVGIYNVAWPKQTDVDGNILPHRPGPMADPKMRDEWCARRRGPASTFYFGFLDYEQATRWFDLPDEYVDFAKVGVGISVYEVPDEEVIVGEYQIVFVRDKATRISWVPLAQQIGQIAA